MPEPAAPPPPEPAAAPDPVVDQYRELRQVARKLLLAERPGHSLLTTDLAHEAWLRLAGDASPATLTMDEFRRRAALVMRHLLIDRARARATHKRGGRLARVSLDALDLASTGSFAELLAVDDAIENLAAQDANLAEVVRLRFFAGLDIEETARVLGQSTRTVNRDWNLARALLWQMLQGEG